MIARMLVIYVASMAAVPDVLRGRADNAQEVIRKLGYGETEKNL